jgi:hypothetical protein
VRDSEVGGRVLGVRQTGLPPGVGEEKFRGGVGPIVGLLLSHSKPETEVEGDCAIGALPYARWRLRGTGPTELKVSDLAGGLNCAGLDGFRGLLVRSVLPSRSRDDAAAARNADSEEKFSDMAAGALEGVLDAGLI